MWYLLLLPVFERVLSRYLKKPGTYSQPKLWATRASNRASDVDSYGRPLPSGDKTTRLDLQKFPIVGEKR